jgi:hypothetical protein
LLYMDDLIGGVYLLINTFSKRRWQMTYWGVVVASS